MQNINNRQDSAALVTQAITIMTKALAVTAFALLCAVSILNKPAHAVDAPKIVVLGDSLTAGYQLPPGKGFPDRLELTLDDKGVDAQIIGAGVSGDTTSGGLARLNWSVPEGIDGVILELGANDALRGLPPETTRKNLSSMIEQLQERGIKVFLTGMLAPPNMGEDYAKAFNAIYPELAEKFNVPLYPFFLDGVTAQPKMLLSDGLHPNEDGVDLIVSKILPQIEAFIEELRPSP